MPLSFPFLNFPDSSTCHFESDLAAPCRASVASRLDADGALVAPERVVRPFGGQHVLSFTSTGAAR
jgi:hypothetical protein